MDVISGGLREVVIDDEIHAFEVNAAPEQVCRNQDPNLPRAELADDIVALQLRVSWAVLQEAKKNPPIQRQ